MRQHERLRGLVRAPRLLWEVLGRGDYDFSYDMMPFEARGMSWRKRWNLAVSGTHLIRRALTPWNLPLHLHVELASFCNLRCPVCPTGNRTLVRKPMSFPVGLFDRLMAEVGPYLLTMSLWGWGEPLLHPRLADMLRIARRYPIATLLSTNGQKLDDDAVIAALIEHPPTHLIVALDGITEESNAKFRVGARLAPALEGVRRLAALKRERGQALPVLHMRHIMMRHNQAGEARLLEFAREAAFDFMSLRTLLNHDTTQTAESGRIHEAFLPPVEEQRAYEYRDGQRVRRTDFVCQQPFWFPAVFADGTVVSCEQDHNATHPFGVYSERVSFADVWFSRQAQRVRRLVRDHPETLEFCRGCPLADRPTSACSFRSFDLRDGRRFPAPARC
jgi:MoaA/NifB/PqqE/SkfB family radical SAM enzyme